MAGYWPIALGACLGLLLGCAGPLERGERLYRQGDLAGARQAWRAVPPADRAYPEVQKRLEVVEEEFERALLRYEKQAAFFESEKRLAESILYYRLAYKLDGSRAGLLDSAHKLSLREAEQAAVDRLR